MTVKSTPKLDEALRRLAADRLDSAAWGEIYSALAPRAYAQAYRILSGDRPGAEDVCHDAFVRFLSLEVIKDLKNSDDFVRYFSVMVRNVCLDRLRHKVRRQSDLKLSHFEDFDNSKPYTEELGDEYASSPEQIALSREELIRMAAKLNPSETLLLELLMDGYTTEEIAARLGVNYQNAAVRIFRLRKRLRGIDV